MTSTKQLTFRLADEEYGVDILCVREIRSWSRITCIPQAPDYMPGILNLRGTPVPVLDLRIRFGLERGEYDRHTVMVVVAVDERLFGLVVDAVSDVIDIDAEHIRPVPDMGAIVDTRYLVGLIEHDGRMVMLANLEALMHPGNPEGSEIVHAARPDARDTEVTV